MNTKSTHQFSSECGKARIFVENEMAIGAFHDFLMIVKGLMVDRMVKAHQDQQAEAEAAKNETLPQHESELPSSCEGGDCSAKEE